jgi:hypothetical protein
VVMGQYQAFANMLSVTTLSASVPTRSDPEAPLAASQRSFPYLLARRGSPEGKPEGLTVCPVEFTLLYRVSP